MQHAIEQAYRRKGAFGSLDALLGWSAVVEQGQLNVVQRGRSGQEIKRLEDEPHFLVAHLGQIIFLESAHQPAGEPVFTARRHVEAAEQIHERGFPRAGGAHDGSVFSAPDLEIDATKRVHPFDAGQVVLGELFGLDDDAAIDQILTERFGSVRFHGNQHTLECGRASGAVRPSQDQLDAIEVGDLAGFRVHFGRDGVGFAAREVTLLLEFENVPMETIGGPLTD